MRGYRSLPVEVGSVKVLLERTALAMVLVGATGCFGNDARQTWDPPNTEGGTATRWQVTDPASGAVLGEGCIPSPTETPMRFLAAIGQVVEVTVTVQRVISSKPRDLDRCNNPCDCDPALTRVSQPHGLVDPICWTVAHSVGSRMLRVSRHDVAVLGVAIDRPRPKRDRGRGAPRSLPASGPALQFVTTSHRPEATLHVAETSAGSAQSATTHPQLSGSSPDKR
jgi:hypothetical protein